MGRHSREGDSPAQSPSAPSHGRHRRTTPTRRFSLTSYFRRPRHRPHAAPNPDVFRHEGADAAWVGTLTGMVATTKPGMRPVPQPQPLSQVAREALGPVPISQFVEPVSPRRSVYLPLPPRAVERPSLLDLTGTLHLDPPTHYRKLLALPVPSPSGVTR